MKTKHNFLILIVLAGMLFVARDDVKIVYNRVISYIKSSDIKTKSQNSLDKIIIKSEKILSPESPISTPGALKITSGLAYSSDSVKLTVKDVITMTNKNRIENGNIPVLIENKQLDSSAQKKLEDMLNKQYFEHVSPDGVGVSELAHRASYEYIIIGENLALGNFKDSKALLDAWMASPGHRANILNNKYTEIGVAVGHGMYQGRDTWFAVQHFGLPKSACPSVDDVLHGSITLLETNVKSMISDLNTRKERIDSGVVSEGMTTNEQISKYNDLVGKYNQMVMQLKEKISQYNEGVKLFNTCISNNTSEPSPTTH